MALRYEVWDKTKIGQRNGLPDRVHYVIDTAMLSAIELSVGTTKKQVYVPDKSNPWDDGKYEEIEVPNAFAVVERGDKQSRIRGWGLAGVWRDAKDCKRCGNSGDDPNVYNLPCNSCKGASYSPKV